MTWYENDKHRYVLELEVLNRNHPGARIVINNGRAFIFYRYSGNKDEYIVKIEYPTNFPFSPPNAFIVEPKIRDSPHQYNGGKLCLHGSSEIGPETTGKIILDWSIEWLKSYEKWLNKGSWFWPTKGAKR